MVSSPEGQFLFDKGECSVDAGLPPADGDHLEALGASDLCLSLVIVDLDGRVALLPDVRNGAALFTDYKGNSTGREHQTLN